MTINPLVRRISLLTVFAATSLIAVATVGHANCPPWDGTPSVTSQCGMTRLNSFPERTGVCYQGSSLICKDGSWVPNLDSLCTGKPDTPSPAPDYSAIPEACGRSGSNNSGPGGGNRDSGDNEGPQMPGSDGNNSVGSGVGMGGFTPDGPDVGAPVDPSSLPLQVAQPAPRELPAPPQSPAPAAAPPPQYYAPQPVYTPPPPAPAPQASDDTDNNDDADAVPIPPAFGAQMLQNDINQKMQMLQQQRQMLQQQQRTGSWPSVRELCGPGAQC